MDLIKNRRNIPRSLMDFIEITGGGNFLYRSPSSYLHQSEEKYKEIRDKEELKPVFLEDTTDDTLVNAKLENYIERIKEDGFYDGIIEIELYPIIII